MLSLINSNSPCLRAGLSLQSLFSPSTPIFPSPLPSSVLIFSRSSPPISYLSLLFHPHFHSLQLYSTLSALSSAPSHFLPIQPFSFLSSTYSPILLPYCEFPLCVSSLSSTYCAIKWFQRRVMLAVDLMWSLETGV